MIPRTADGPLWRAVGSFLILSLFHIDKGKYLR